MRALAPLVLLAVTASTASLAQRSPQPTGFRYRLGASLGTALADLGGESFHVTTSLSPTWGFGANLAVEFSQPTYAFELAAQWLTVRYKEKFILTNVPQPREGSESDALEFVHLTGSMLFHRSFASGNDMLAGFILGTAAGEHHKTPATGRQLLGDGLTYGLQAIFGFPTKSASTAMTVGLQYLVLPTGGDYDADQLQLLLLQVGLRLH